MDKHSANLKKGSIVTLVLILVVLGIFASVAILASNVTDGRPLDFIKNLLTSPCTGINCASPTPVATASATPAGPVEKPKLQTIKKEYQQCLNGLPRVPFAWQPSVGATSYEVHLSRNHGFSPHWKMTLPYQVNPPIPGTGFFWWSDTDPVFRAGNGNSIKPVEGARYYWRVTATNGQQNATSKTSSFRAINCYNK